MSELPFLRNRYWILRHGRSIPNEKGLIVSSMENGLLKDYGLANEGLRQAELAGELFFKELKECNIDLDKVQICYSPFSRTVDTAKLVSKVLNIPFEGPSCKVIEGLRERFFGPTFELLSHDKYPEIWTHDEKDPFMPLEGGESVADVVSRLASTLATIEMEFQGCAILIVSHGDPLQILQTILYGAQQIDSLENKDLLRRIKEVTVHPILAQHRKFALNTGELRQII